MLGSASALSNSISVILADWSSLSAILYPIICVCIEFKVVASSNFISGIFTLELALSNSISVFCRCYGYGFVVLFGIMQLYIHKMF